MEIVAIALKLKNFRLIVISISLIIGACGPAQNLPRRQGTPINAEPTGPEPAWSVPSIAPQELPLPTSIPNSGSVPIETGSPNELDIPHETTPTIRPAYLPLVVNIPTPTVSSTSSAVPIHPNIVIIISDDQRHDSMDFMPRTRARIFDQGIKFTRGYITTSSCCPSRASILTGMYAHNHGVHLNDDPLEKRTFIEALKEIGYQTALVGKYLNSWDGSARPEFDYWVSFEWGSVSYFDPHLNVHGAWENRAGYITQILQDHAVDFLDGALNQENPFILVFSPNAPHEPALPAPGDENLYPDLPPHRPPNFNEEQISDKPGWIQDLLAMAEDDIEDIDKNRTQQLQSLNALDLAVDSILDKLGEYGELDQTFIVYISDNGYFWGEHRLERGKGYAYEESILVPFAIYYPPLIPEARIENRLAANIDIAPTIYDLVGLAPPAEIDGSSLLDLIQAKVDWRERLIIENWIEPGHYSAVRSDQFLYVQWDQFLPELYDTSRDPYQLENLAGLPEFAPMVNDFRNYLEATLSTGP